MFDNSPLTSSWTKAVSTANCRHSPRGRIERARLWVIWDCLSPAQHDNPCSSFAPESAEVGKEIRQQDLQATAIADKVVDV